MRAQKFYYMSTENKEAMKWEKEVARDKEEISTQEGEN